MLAVLLDPGVIDNPRLHADLRRDPLRACPHDHLGIPGRVGQKLLQRLVGRLRLAQPKQRRLQTLPATMLDQAAHIDERVLPLPHVRQLRHDLGDEPGQTLPRLHRRHLEDGRCFHHPLPKR